MKDCQLGFVLSSVHEINYTGAFDKVSPPPIKFILMYKFSQEHLELFFNKIRCRCGWNSNPNVLQFKYALRILIRNSIEPLNIGNCSHVDDALCESNGLFDLTVKRNQIKQITSDEYSLPMLIQLDQETPTELLDNVLYYILGIIVRSLLQN